MKKAVDERVHILVRGKWLLTTSETLANGIEAALNCLALVEREYVGAPERQGPGLRESDVVGPEAEVDTDGIVERVERGRRARAEAPTPELVGLRSGGAFGNRHGCLPGPRSQTVASSAA